VIGKYDMQREVKITLDFVIYPISSVLIETGRTMVLCNVTTDTNVPSFAKDQGKGWITAEYGMLPASTGERMRREASQGKITGRTSEIQRFIGRSLRSVVNLEQLMGFSLIVDCDVIQADGGTRTAGITGAALALYIALEKMFRKNLLACNPMSELIAAVSVGIHNEEIVVDLDYQLDSSAQVDMNVVMTESGQFVEIQGTGEQRSFSRTELQLMLEAAEHAIQHLLHKQRKLIEGYFA